MRTKGVLERLGGLGALGRVVRAERAERRDACALDLVGHAHDGCLDDGLVADQGAFDFHRAQAVAGDIDDIVDASHDPEVAIVVALGAVAREVPGGGAGGRGIAGVFDLEPGPVGLDEAFAIAVDAAQHAGPRASDCKQSPAAVGQFGAVLVADRGVDAEEWQGA